MTCALGFLFAAFITLHTPSGRPMFVNADEIMVIREAEPAQGHFKGCGAAVIVHDKELCVRETPREVREKVDAHSP